VAGRDGVLAIGGSAGGIEALAELAAALPANLPACVLVTIHVGGNARSSLPRILSREGPLPAVHARHGEPLLPGRIYVAPPDFHLLAGSGVARLSSGPRVNRHRPAVDVMFASAARWAGPRVVAVVLSGVLDDGAVGAALVARAGGRIVVQDPVDAVFASMPRSALAAVPGATTARTTRLGTVIDELLREQRKNDRDDDGGQEMHETSMADSSDPAFLTADEARLTRLSCPECSGGLAEIDLGGIRYYRCHVGHQYAPRSLEAAQREAAESKLWAAAAALEEHAAMARHLAGQRDGAIREDEAEGYRLRADRSAEAARSVVTRLRERKGAVSGPVDEGGPGLPALPVRTGE
jgi:two-component system chemotaxis response regulator CheB